MDRASAWSTRTRKLAPVFAWAAAVAAAIALGVYAEPPQPGGTGATGRMLPRVPLPPPDLPVLLDQIGVGSVNWYAGALALPFLLWGARALDTGRLGRAGTLAVSTAVLASLVTGATFVQYLLVYQGAPTRPSAATYFLVSAHRNALPWIALAGVVVAVEARRRSGRSVLERERLRAQVAEQRLIALTGQLQPHFLFNTLQALSTLIHRDPDAADEMLAKLADLLRDLLRQRDRVIVPLAEEIRHARTYLELARLRFADRLAFDIEVPSGLERLAVPLFILQPLVENALAHGIGARMGNGRIRLRAAREGDRLRLEVEDDGPGAAKGEAPREGIGLSNTRERLRASFGDEQRLSLRPGIAGGMVARIEIPARPCARSAETA